MEKFKGTGVALVTPFLSDGSVDFDGLAHILDFTAQGVDYYVVLGTTGESATTTAEEKSKILQFVKDNNPKKLPIVYGAGGNNTAQVARDIEHADLNGVDAILSISPYYNKPSQQGIIAHYEYLADHSPLPIILYNAPGRTMSNISAQTTLTLSKHPNIIGTKEASGNFDQFREIIDGMGPDFFLTSGDDLLTTEIMELGGIGVISVLANGFPKEFSKIARTALEGDFDGSRAVTASFEEINPLMYIESNPVGIKEVLHQKGVCGNQVRLPLLPASSALQAQIAELIK